MSALLDERTETVEHGFGPNFCKSLVCSEPETFLICFWMLRPEPEILEMVGGSKALGGRDGLGRQVRKRDRERERERGK